MSDANHPAIQAYRDAAHRYPPKTMYEEIIAAVGEKPEHMKLLWDVVHDWVGRGWNPNNAVAILEVFRDRRGTDARVDVVTDPDTGLCYQVYADGYRELIVEEQP